MSDPRIPDPSILGWGMYVGGESDMQYSAALAYQQHQAYDPPNSVIYVNPEGDLLSKVLAVAPVASSGTGPTALAAMQTVLTWVNSDPNSNRPFEFWLYGAIGSFNAEYGGRTWIDSALATIAQSAGLPTNFDWKPYLAVAVVQHGGIYDAFTTNYALPVLYAVNAAVVDYPQLAPIVPKVSPGSTFWDQGEQMRAQADLGNRTWERKTDQGAAVMAAAFLIGGYFAAGALGAEAATATTAGTVAAESGVAVVQGAELAALVESGTVGVEGAFLEAAALSGSSVTYATGTGAILSAVTPAGETVLFDAAVDPFTQFGQMSIDKVQLPQESAQMPQQTQQAPQSSSIPKPVTNYATKLLASEAVKMLTGSPQSPGARASLATDQGLAPGSETGDITPLVALAMIAGAFMLR